jgi:hypothetical protein
MFVLQNIQDCGKTPQFIKGTASSNALSITVFISESIFEQTVKKDVQLNAKASD